MSIALPEYIKTVASFIKLVCSATEFINSLNLCCMNCVKVVRLKPDKTNQWLGTGLHQDYHCYVTTFRIMILFYYY